MLLVAELVSAHPVLNLPKQDVLCLRVAEQAVKFYGQLRPFNYRFVLRAESLHAVERDRIVDVFDLLSIVLVMKPLYVVPELEWGPLLVHLRSLILRCSRIQRGSVTEFGDFRRVLGLVLSQLAVLEAPHLCCLQVKRALQRVINTDFTRIDEFFVRILALEHPSALLVLVDAHVALLVGVRHSALRTLLDLPHAGHVHVRGWCRLLQTFEDHFSPVNANIAVAVVAIVQRNSS